MRRLLIRPGAIGDCILSFPALECLKAGYTEVWVPSNVVPLVRFADCVRPIASTGIDLLGLPGIEPPPLLLERLRSFHSIVSWYGANRDEFRAGIRDLGLPVQFLSALPGESEGLHAADFFLGQAACPGRAVPRIPVPPQVRGEFAAIHPFSGSVRKNWPLERFHELARWLPLPVQWSSGPSEKLQGAVRYQDLYELGCWLASAAVYIGNDSGITHLAAAVGTPVVAIFGATDPVVWAPRGEKVRVLHRDLDQIRVEEVLEAVTEQLAILPR